jgi:DNA-binding transcriptional ArsR family regulator
MPKEKFVLVSLQEEKAKKLAQVISNESCRRILDYLADKDATETQLAKELEIPISTVHYNLKLLTEGGLVRADEFHYSAKGKEVNHYRLANKYIIIAPKTAWGIKEKLKSILPAALIVGAGAGIAQLVLNYLSRPQVAPMMVRAPADKIATGAPTLGATAEQAVWQAGAWTSSLALWFVLGAMTALLLYLAFDYIRSGRQK